MEEVTMKLFLRLSLAAAAISAVGSSASACTGGACANGLAYEAYGEAAAGASPVLAVFVHGDVSSGGPADYMYATARSFAAGRKGVVAIALLRPGYYDRAGKQSGGSDNGRRDTFYASNNRMVAGAIAELKQKYKARRVVALGHSGGAGAIGVIAGNNPGLIDGMVLVSCPCDVPRWMATRNGTNRSMSSQSPVDYISGLPRGLPIVAVTGQDDDNTRPLLATEYVDKAKAAGMRATARIVPGGHGFTGISGTAVGALANMVR
jgi:pimeloyl-ACP methyl ester carboxylesterase